MFLLILVVKTVSIYGLYRGTFIRRIIYMASVIERIDVKNPSFDDLVELQEELKKMKEVDIRTVKKEDLVEVSDVTVDPNLPKLERILTFIKQVRNPYCYVWHGVIIKTSFAGEKSIDDCFTEALFGGGHNGIFFDRKEVKHEKKK